MIPCKLSLRVFIVALVVSILGFTSIVRAMAPDSVPEYEVKAAMIYNFALFVEWPKEVSPSSPIVVGVLGDDPFGPILENTFRGKTAQGRGIQIRRFASQEELQPCEILFVSQSERKRMSEITDAIGRNSVLTIGDMKDFTELGGVIGFKIEDKQIRFEINLEAAQRAGLKISYKLLRLALLRPQVVLKQE